jgi:hypothetical protein
MDDNKLLLRAKIEANKLGRLPLNLQNNKLKEFKKKYETNRDKKLGFLIEILSQKIEEAEDNQVNMEYGCEF